MERVILITSENVSRNSGKGEINLKKEVLEKVEGLLKGFKLPSHRKTIRGGDSVKWLLKNLKRDNESNPAYQETMELLRSL